MQSSDLDQRVVAAIRQVIGVRPAPLHEPRFAGNEWAYVKDCLDSTFVSSVGAYVDRIEVQLAHLCGVRHAVAVVNGTAALHIALLLAGVKSGDEVIVPTLTFVATANAVRYCDAVPHFAEADELTLGISADALRAHLESTTDQHGGLCVNRSTGRIIRAMVVMHTFGHPGDLDGLLAVANDYGIVLVEDAAESLGSLYRGVHTGGFGLLGTLSFNGNKTVTTGGGGAILTNDAELGRRAKHLTTTAKLAHRWSYTHDQVGYNYRMPNINAALGCAQLEQLDGFLASKRTLHEAYLRAFSSVEGVALVREPAGCRSNFWLQALLLDEACSNERDRILAATNDAGFMSRPAWTLMHRLDPYADCPRMPTPVAESLERRLINIPSSAGLIEVRQ